MGDCMIAARETTARPSPKLLHPDSRTGQQLAMLGCIYRVNDGDFMSRSFMTGPELLASLAGQQYIVLRPSASVMTMYERVQTTAKSTLSSVVTYPNTGHITLRGFFEPDRVEDLKQVVRQWAAEQGSIELRVEAVASFPAPFKIMIARLERTPSLQDAYAGLTARLDQTDFNRIGELSLADWVFHMSIAYCSELSGDAWDSTKRAFESELTDGPVEVATEVEFVWYQDGMEHRENMAFSQ